MLAVSGTEIFGDKFHGRTRTCRTTTGEPSLNAAGPASPIRDEISAQFGDV